MFQINLIVKIKQKPIADSQKKKRESKHTTMENHQFAKEGSKRERKELQNSQKIINKIALVSPYLPIITLNVNGLNPPIRRLNMAEWIKKHTTEL